MKPNLSLIKQVLNLPTAPFHEEGVISFIQDFCKKQGLRCNQDRYGNLKVIYKKGQRNKPIALLAHMDHPGFEVVKGGLKPIVRLLGGVPEKYFFRSKVIIWSDEKPVKGKVVKYFNKKKKRYQLEFTEKVSKGSFGYFDLKGVTLKKDFIYTKAADNLISVAILLNLLLEIKRDKENAHVICLFTRAEEVGFVGTSGVIKNRFLSPKIPLLVLEASSAKAGPVTIGKGPVLRVGDLISTFSNTIDLWLHVTALKLAKEKKPFQFQRALLPGGRCEATVFMKKGFEVGCVALPLGNYHNQGEKSYAQEYINIKDYKNMLLWLFTLAQNVSLRAVAKKAAKDIEAIFKRDAKRLIPLPKKR